MVVIDYLVFYIMLEGGVSFLGIIVKLGYEVFGLDDGMYGFVILLVILYKFNGWFD